MYFLASRFSQGQRQTALKQAPSVSTEGRGLLHVRSIKAPRMEGCVIASAYLAAEALGEWVDGAALLRTVESRTSGLRVHLCLPVTHFHVVGRPGCPNPCASPSNLLTTSSRRPQALPGTQHQKDFCATVASRGK